MWEGESRWSPRLRWGVAWGAWTRGEGRVCASGSRHAEWLSSRALFSPGMMSSLRSLASGSSVADVKEEQPCRGVGK